MDVQALQARLAAFAAERGWDEIQNPRNLAIALAGEAGMLLDLFRWLTDAQSQGIASEYKREAAAEAIADLILHTLRLADKLDIDVERAIEKKLAENDANYPRPVSAHAPPVVVAPVAMPAPRPAEKTERIEKTEKSEKIEKAEKAEKKETARPVEEQKAAPPPEPVASPPAPAPQEAKRTAEPPKAPADKALPNWLDGILPARSTTARKKLALPPKAAAEPPKSPEPPKPLEPAIPPEAPEPPEAAQAPEPPPDVEPIEAAPPPPLAAEREPALRPKPQPSGDLHASQYRCGEGVREGAREAGRQRPERRPAAARAARRGGDAAPDALLVLAQVLVDGREPEDDPRHPRGGGDALGRRGDPRARLHRADRSDAQPVVASLRRTPESGAGFPGCPPPGRVNPARP